MAGLIKLWIKRLEEYEAEVVDYLTIILCFMQCWRLKYNSAARDAENIMHERAAASTSDTKRTRGTYNRIICFESPARGQQRRIIEFHKAQIAFMRAKIRFWFFNAIRSSKRNLAHQELQRLETNYDWVVYDWFSVARPIPLRKVPANGSLYLDQSQSAFFQLPTEIRQLVYKIHLTGLTIDLVLHEGSEYAPSAYKSRVYLNWGYHERHGMSHFVLAWQKSKIPLRYHGKMIDFGIVKFLLSCKRIHTEATPILYGENLWTQSSDLVQRNSPSLTRYLLPEQLCSIRRLRFDLDLGGDLSLDIIEHLPSLYRLDIRAFDFNPHSDFTASQLWRKLESVFPILEKKTDTIRITIFVEDCIPIGNSSLKLVPIETDVRWFSYNCRYDTDHTTGKSTVIGRVRPEPMQYRPDFMVTG